MVFAKKHSQLEVIQYKCDNCGVDVSIQGDIPRCIGCGKALCEVCNTYFLCPADYHALSNKDKKKIKKNRNQLNNAKNAKVVFTIMPLILGILGLTLIILMIIFQKPLFYFLFGFLGGFLLLSGILFFLMFYNIESRETKRIKQKMKEILIPYRIKPIHSSSISVTSQEGEQKDLFCPSCGEKIRNLNKKICEFCGTSLANDLD